MQLWGALPPTTCRPAARTCGLGTCLRWSAAHGCVCSDAGNEQPASAIACACCCCCCAPHRSAGTHGRGCAAQWMQCWWYTSTATRTCWCCRWVLPSSGCPAAGCGRARMVGAGRLHAFLPRSTAPASAAAAEQRVCTACVVWHPQFSCKWRSAATPKCPQQPTTPSRLAHIDVLVLYASAHLPALTVAVPRFDPRPFLSRLQRARA